MAGIFIYKVLSSANRARLTLNDYLLTDGLRRCRDQNVSH